ncbi:hypothetical protein BJ508DRAFT_418827, partial [Ascobolus immersus RN42]
MVSPNGDESSASMLLETTPPQFKSWTASPLQHPVNRWTHHTQCGQPGPRRNNCWCTEAPLDEDDFTPIAMHEHKLPTFREFLRSCPLEFGSTEIPVDSPIILQDSRAVMEYFDQTVLQPILPLLSIMHRVADTSFQTAFGNMLFTERDLRLQTQVENHILETNLVSTSPRGSGRFTVLTIAHLPPSTLFPTLMAYHNRHVDRKKFSYERDDWKRLSALIRSYGRFSGTGRVLGDGILEQSQRRVMLTDGAGWMLIEFQAGSIRTGYGAVFSKQWGLTQGYKTIKEAIAYAVYKTHDADLKFDGLDQQGMRSRWEMIISKWKFEEDMAEAEGSYRGLSIGGRPATQDDINREVIRTQLEALKDPILLLFPPQSHILHMRFSATEPDVLFCNVRLKYMMQESPFCPRKCKEHRDLPSDSVALWMDLMYSEQDRVACKIKLNTRSALYRLIVLAGKASRSAADVARLGREMERLELQNYGSGRVRGKVTDKGVRKLTQISFGEINRLDDEESPVCWCRFCDRAVFEPLY